MSGFLDAREVKFVGANIDAAIADALVAIQVKAVDNCGRGIKRAGIDAWTIGVQSEVLIVGSGKEWVFIKAVLINHDNIMIRDILKSILNQAVMKLRSIIIIRPRPHLHRLVKRRVVGVAVNDAVPHDGRTMLVEEDAATVDADGEVANYSEVAYQR